MFCYPGQQNNLQFLLSRIAKQYTIFCYPGQQNFLLSRIAKQFVIKQFAIFAILDSKTFFFAVLDSKTVAIHYSKTIFYPGQKNNLQFLLSWIAKQITIFVIQDSKTLLSRIAKQFAIFAILDSKTIYNFCYPGQQKLCYPGQQKLCYPGQQIFKKLLSLGTFIHD